MSFANRAAYGFPAHRVHHSETIIAVVAFSLRSLSKDRHTKTNLTFYRDDVAVAMTTQMIEHSNYIPRTTFFEARPCTLYYTVSDKRLGLGTRLDCHGQGYDNGSNMSGSYKGAQARIIQKILWQSFAPVLATV